MLNPKGNKYRIIAYVDADHAHKQETQRSVMGIIILINNIPITRDQKEAENGGVMKL